MYTPQILKALHHIDSDPELRLVHQKQHCSPVSVSYVIKRFAATPSYNEENGGLMVYHTGSKPEENYFELRYCLSGGRYCDQLNCSLCKDFVTDLCNISVPCVDVFSFRFVPEFMMQFTKGVKSEHKKDHILSFSFPQSFNKFFPVCNKIKMTLQAMVSHNFSGSMENLYLTARAHELLLYSLECLVEENEEQVFSCKFLADESGREKIYQARDILLQHIGSPLTIKELSRKVAINECYLKKGFKEVFGATIFEFYQQQRMEHAKFLLYEKNLSVTDVSDILGYSSISHFSAAFKKYTGLKPCELLR